MAEPWDLEVDVIIPRPPAEVRAWWTEMPKDYHAADPHEQPHHIVTRHRDKRTWEIDTYWRVPLAPNLRVPETFTFRPDGWTVDLRVPGGIGQRDDFTLVPTPDGTRVEIRVRIHARNAAGKLLVPFYRRYGQRNFPALWRAAGILCARDAPHLPTE